jgi:hypothetical protein
MRSLGRRCKRKISPRCVDFVEMYSRLWSLEENQESGSAPKLPYFTFRCVVRREWQDRGS